MPITITFSVAGSYTVEDDGTPGNNTSIVRRVSDGVILAVIPHPADALIFRAIVPGVNLTFDVTDPLGSASLTVGSLTNTAETPDSVTIRSINSSGLVTVVSNGAIVEGGADAAADIVAGSLILSAGTGVGTAGNAIETQTGLLEAETVSGGISIANVGNLQVGGFSANVDGLDVVTSGDIFLTNLGSITLSDETSFDSVHGGDASGNVTLVANGYDSDITSNVDQSSIIAPRGSVFLTAGRDVSFGLGGVEFGNDVRANGSIVVDAGRDFLLSGFADFFADGILGTSGGSLIVNAGRNISLLDDTGNSASLAVLGTGGGDIILTTGPNGRVTLEPPSTNTLSSGSGSVIVNADRIVILATSGITAPVDVTVRPVSDGRAILLGSLSDSGAAVELSDGELDRIFTETLILGGSSTGQITVGAPIAPASVDNWTLLSGADILIHSSLTVPGVLKLLAGDSIFQTAGVLTAATFLAAVDQVGDDGGVGGTANFLGSTAATTINIFGNADNDSLTGTDGNDVLLGGAGLDILDGGLGDDVIYVDDSGDTVRDADAPGSVDRVATSVSYNLPGPAAIEVFEAVDSASTAALNLAGNGFAQLIVGNAGNNVISGNGGNDTLIGLAGNDTLLDGAGNDTLYGGTGNDVYFVDAAGDQVFEFSGEGTDRVATAISYTLAVNASIETFETVQLSSTAAINLTGSTANQFIIGNNGNNMLQGGGGNDHMIGAGGNDTFVGNSSAGLLEGGLGNDVYFIIDSSDLIIETSGGGNDRAAVNTSYALGANAEVETLETFSLAGTSALNLTGNLFQNLIIGNNGVNTLDGKGGNDVLIGAGGVDTFAFTTAMGAGNVDAIEGFVSGQDKIALDDAIFTAIAPGALQAGAFHAGTAAADVADRVIYNATTGALFYDPDGTGAAAQVQFATLSGGPALSGSDFILV